MGAGGPSSGWDPQAEALLPENADLGVSDDECVTCWARPPIWERGRGPPPFLDEPQSAQGSGRFPVTDAQALVRGPVGVANCLASPLAVGAWGSCLSRSNWVLIPCEVGLVYPPPPGAGFSLPRSSPSLRLEPTPWGSAPGRYGSELRGRATALRFPLRSLVPQSRSSECLDFGGLLKRLS